MRSVCRPNPQYPSQLSAQLRRRVALSASLGARRQAGRRHLSLRDRRSRPGAHHRARRYPRDPQRRGQRPGALRQGYRKSCTRPRPTIPPGRSRFNQRAPHRGALAGQRRSRPGQGRAVGLPGCTTSCPTLPARRRPRFAPRAATRRQVHRSRRDQKPWFRPAALAKIHPPISTAGPIGHAGIGVRSCIAKNSYDQTRKCGNTRPAPSAGPFTPRPYLCWSNVPACIQRPYSEFANADVAFCLPSIEFSIGSS